MKFSMSSRQNGEYLSKADEIKIAWRDRDIIFDLVEKYPDKDLVLQVPYQQEIDWELLSNYKIITQGKLTLCLQDLSIIPRLRELGLKYYYGFSVGTFYEIHALKHLGVCCVRLAPPAFFSLPKVKMVGVPVRLTPNVADDGYYMRDDGVIGPWVRPEDLDAYAPYVEVVEFDGVELSKERALYRIYKEEKNWPGDVNMIISNLRYPATNRLILPQFGTARINCGQRCAEGNGCNLCFTILKAADEELIQKMKDAREAVEDI